MLPGWDVGRNAGWSLDGSLGRSGPGLALLHSTPHSHLEPGIPRGLLLSAGDVFFRLGPLGGLILLPELLPFPLVTESLLAMWRGRRRCRRCRIMHQWPYWHPYTSNLRLVADYGRSNYHAPNMEAARGRLLNDSHHPCLMLKVEGKKKAHRSGRGPGQGILLLINPPQKNNNKRADEMRTGNWEPDRDIARFILLCFPSTAPRNATGRPRAPRSSRPQ